MTRNITLAIDDALLDKVRVLAAMKRTSVNEMVRGFLARLVEEETEHDE
ncbi:ribbon-helix-helix protein, CopG family, partial [Acinetobacter baumannii]